MQSVSWYVNRLKGMSFGELIWRFSALGQTQLDRFRIEFGWHPSRQKALSERNGKRGAFRVSRIPVGKLKKMESEGVAADWEDALVHRASLVSKGRLSFFDLENVNLGDPIDWHRDHGLEKKCEPDHNVATCARHLQASLPPVGG